MNETLPLRPTRASGRASTRAEDLRDMLERMIVSGEMSPGDRLDETELAKRFDVSRTPIREAIKALIGTGLVEVKGRQGATVATLSIPMLIEMFDLMSALEGLCAHLAARRATRDEKAAMRDVHARLIAAYEANDPDAFYRINGEFHDLLYASAHTHFLAGQTIALRLRLAPYRRKVTYQPGRMRDTLKEHEAIIEAIEQGEPERALACASEHVRLLGDHLSDFIATIPANLLS